MKTKKFKKATGEAGGSYIIKVKKYKSKPKKRVYLHNTKRDNRKGLGTWYPDRAKTYDIDNQLPF